MSADEVPGDFLPEIRTYTAAEFVCDNCGRVSYFSLVSLDDESIAEETRMEMKEDLRQLNDSEAGELGEFVAGFVAEPDVVSCQHCGTKYRPIGRGDENESEDYE